MIKRFIIVVVACLLIPFSTLVEGQAIPSSRLGWNQDAPTLADAQGYTYKYYADGSANGVALTNVTCTGSASPYTCTVAFPAFTPGNHRITLTATNLAGEGAQSLPLDFTFIVTPAAPTGLRIIGG